MERPIERLYMLELAIEDIKDITLPSAGLAIWEFGAFPKGLLREAGEDQNGFFSSKRKNPINFFLSDGNSLITR